MRLRDCTFETDRLLATEWRSVLAESWQQQDLELTVAGMLTEPVTRHLPEPWHGSYTTERARRWIEERDAEGTTLLIVETSSRSVVGLLLLIQCGAPEAVEIRIGYLISEAFWGRGFASELIRGLVAWTRLQSSVASLAGGVAPDNVASARVLAKNGFLESATEDESGGEETIWRLSLRT